MNGIHLGEMHPLGGFFFFYKIIKFGNDVKRYGNIERM
jgi:hypothetical protein